MNRDEKLVLIASDDNETYENRKRALDEIHDKHIINHLAETVKDDWIQLESAILCNNRRVLNLLINNQDEEIQLESAIELNNQKCLAHIVINSDDPLHRNIALKNITSKTILRNIVEQCTSEKEKVEAALRIGNQEIIRLLMPVINNEELRLRMAESVNDVKAITALSRNASDSRIRQLASEWVSGLAPESDID